MNIRELEYFAVIAEEKNLSHAADRLYIGQPTLSKFIQRLEEEIGIPLFNRFGREMILTYAGERYLMYARRILADKRALDNEMQDIRKSDIGSLRVGMPPVRCSMVLPRVLPAFHTMYPKVTFHITEDTSENLDLALVRGEIDLAFFSMSEPRSELSYEVLRRDRMYAVVKAGHPVGQSAFTAAEGEKCIRLGWLKNEVFLVQNRKQRQGYYIRQILQEQHLSGLNIQEHSNIRAAMSLAAGGYGVTFLAGSFKPYFEELMSFDSYLIDGVSRRIDFAAAWNRGVYMPGYASAFIRLVRDTFASAL